MAKKKSKGVIEKIGDAVSASAEAVYDAGAKAVHAVGDLLPAAKPAPKRGKAKAATPKKSAPKKTAAKAEAKTAKPKAAAVKAAAVKAPAAKVKAAPAKVASKAAAPKTTKSAKRTPKKAAKKK
jgi:hypothetical protein